MNSEYGFGKINVKQFRESCDNWLSSTKIDYSNARLSCTSCNSLNITCDGGGCTCSVCTGNFTILHGDQSNLTIVDWRGVKDDETKPVVRGWKNCDLEKKVRESMKAKLSPPYRCGVVAVLVRVGSKHTHYVFERKLAAVGASLRDPETTSKKHAEGFAVKKLEELAKTDKDGRYVLFVSMIPCPSCSMHSRAWRHQSENLVSTLRSSSPR